MRRSLPFLLGLLLLAACSREKADLQAVRPSAAPAVATATQAADERFVGILAPLIDPAKLDTLKGDRSANPRFRKICYWLEEARRAGNDPAAVVDGAQIRTGYAGTARAQEDKKALLRNLTILERLGCLDAEGMAKLRRGNAPTITRGPYAGDIAAIDHIIPRSVAPELDEKLFNLEFMPSKLNNLKSNTIGQRQRALAAGWNEERLLSEAGRAAVESALK